MGPLSLALGLVQVRGLDKDHVQRHAENQQEGQNHQNDLGDLPLSPLPGLHRRDVFRPPVSWRRLADRLPLGNGLFRTVQDGLLHLRPTGDGVLLVGSGPPGSFLVDTVSGFPVVLRVVILVLVDPGVDRPLCLPVGLIHDPLAGAFLLLPLAAFLFGKATSLHWDRPLSSSRVPWVFLWMGTPRSVRSSTFISRPRIMALSRSSQTRRRISSTPSKSRLGSM